MIGRREFLFSAGLIPLVWNARASASEASVSNATVGRVPIVQTLTDESSAQFNVLVDPAREPFYRARTQGGREFPLTVASRTNHPFDSKVAFDHVLVEGLSLSEDYIFEVFEGSPAQKVDERIFRALDTRPRACRFAVASCMADVLEVFQAPMWRSMADTRPEVVFLVGDTCYADILTDGSVAGLWKRHVKTRRSLEIFRWKRLVPVFATWDDHDFGKNNGDKTSSKKDDALAVFKALWGWQARGLAREGDGVATAVELCGQRFYLMDDRYFRDPRGVSNARHWGDPQRDWMLNGVASSAAPAWIMNGSQFFGGYIGKESYESDHPEDLAELTYRLRSIDAPVLFCSGDVHYSEVMKIEAKQLGYETFEVTSSSIHSATHPGMNGQKNPRRLKTTWRHNFMIVDTAVDVLGGIRFKTWAVGPKKRTLFEFEGRVVR